MPKRYSESSPSVYVDIGREIMVARRRALLNQRELGKRLGVSHAAISDIERGKSKPNLDVLAEIARALGVPLKQIVVLRHRQPAPRPASTED